MYPLASTRPAPLGLILRGPLADPAGPQSTFLGVALPMLFIGVIALFRRRRTCPRRRAAVIVLYALAPLPFRQRRLPPGYSPADQGMASAATGPTPHFPEGTVVTDRHRRGLPAGRAADLQAGRHHWRWCALTCTEDRG